MAQKKMQEYKTFKFGLNPCSQHAGPTAEMASIDGHGPSLTRARVLSIRANLLSQSNRHGSLYIGFYTMPFVGFIAKVAMSLLAKDRTI